MPFPDMVPTLTGAGVTLRAHRPADAAAVLEQCRDPLHRRWTTLPLDYSYLDAQQYLTELVPAGWRDDTEWAFAVEALDEGGAPRFAGTVHLRGAGPGRAEIGYGAHPWVRGRGAMEAALRLLLTWGFEARDLRTVIWWAQRGNWASRKLAWRVGFRVEGAARQWLVLRGGLHDAWIGTLLAGESTSPRTPWLDVPTITGATVELRRHREGDAERFAALTADAEVRRWAGGTPLLCDPGAAWDHLESQEEGAASGTALSWTIADPGTGTLLGVVTLFGITSGQQAEVGFCVHPDVRGRGVATEACRLAVRHALLPTDTGGLGLRRVRAVAAETNQSSRRALARAGLVEQGRERDLRLGDGEPENAVVADVLAGELGG